MTHELPDTRTAARAGTRTDIQALRALAVALVVTYHLWPAALPGGFIGVDVFFVVSGYLVGGSLLREAVATGRIDLLAFAARRARRILPAASAVLLASTVVVAVWASPVSTALLGGRWEWASSMKDAIASAGQVANLWFAARDAAYDEALASPFAHFWSLGVEAQFYVLMPAIAIACAWLGRRDPRLIPLTLVVLALVSIDAMFVERVLVADSYFMPAGRLWEFLIGVLVASGPALGWRIGPRVGLVARASVGAVGAVVVAAIVRDTPAGWPGLPTLVPVVATAILLVGVHPAWLRRAFRAPAAQWLGDRSYALYLVHWPIALATSHAFGDRLPGLAAPTALVASLLAAHALHLSVERRAMRIPIGTRADRLRMVRMAVAASVSVMIVAGLFGIVSAGRLRAQGAIAGEFEAVPISEAERPAVDAVPSNVRPSLLDAASDGAMIDGERCFLPLRAPVEDARACVWGPEGAPTVVLFGDSHAAQWTAALVPAAESGAFRLVVVTAVRCTPYRGLTTPGLEQRCGEWLDRAVELVAAEQPDLVVIGGRTTYDELSPASDDLPASIAAALDSTLGELAPATVAWLSDTPGFGRDPVECAAELAARVDACAGRADDVLNLAADEAIRDAVEARGGKYLDVAPYLCDQRCPVVRGDVFMYRDDNHVTGTFAAAMAPALGALVIDALGG